MVVGNCGHLCLTVPACKTALFNPATNECKLSSKWLTNVNLTETDQSTLDTLEEAGNNSEPDVATSEVYSTWESNMTAESEASTIASKTKLDRSAYWIGTTTGQNTSDWTSATPPYQPSDGAEESTDGSDSNTGTNESETEVIDLQHNCIVVYRLAPLSLHCADCQRQVGVFECDPLLGAECTCLPGFQPVSTGGCAVDSSRGSFVRISAASLDAAAPVVLALLTEDTRLGCQQVCTATAGCLGFRTEPSPVPGLMICELRSYGPPSGQHTQHSQQASGQRQAWLFWFQPPFGHLPPDQPDFKLINGSMYIANTTEADTAEYIHRQCHLMGGILLPGDDPQLLDQITTAFSFSKDKRFLLGLTDQVSEGKFISTHNASVVKYLHWARGEPNGAREENCVLVQLESVRLPGGTADSPCRMSPVQGLCQYVGPNTDVSEHILDSSQSYSVRLLLLDGVYQVYGIWIMTSVGAPEITHLTVTVLSNSYLSLGQPCINRGNITTGHGFGSLIVCSGAPVIGHGVNMTILTDADTPQGGRQPPELAVIGTKITQASSTAGIYL